MHAAPLVVVLVLAMQPSGAPPDVLPETATARLAQSLAAAERHATHLWRDTPPFNPDGTVNACIEISRGDRRKWEYEMRQNERAIDRVMPAEVGGYPVNYGFVPQTISYDGDPFDVLVLGSPLPGGTVVRGVIVGLLHMDDDKGLDSKVVVSRVDADGPVADRLTQQAQRRIGDFFRQYKRHEPGKFSKVRGWGTAAEGRAFVERTHAFFRECRRVTASPCRLSDGRR